MMDSALNALREEAVIAESRTHSIQDVAPNVKSVGLVSAVDEAVAREAVFAASR
jgi:hypothetical protein